MSIRSDIRTILAAKGKPQRLSRRRQVSVLNETLSAVEKYAKKNPQALSMIRDKNRLAKFLATVAKLFGRKTVNRKVIDAAVRILLASGFEVRPGQTASRTGRGETAGLSPPATAPSPFRSTGPRTRVPAGTEEDPVLAEIVGDGVPVDPQEASRKKQEAATVHLVDSSNVHSYYYVRRERTGTLYVTFLKASAPGKKQKSRKGNGPGPTYAYIDVPVRTYLDFKSAARSSAGNAVWEYLRVRGPGNRARHHFQYVLTRVSPLGVRDTEAYVPRKITRTGFRTRNLPDLSGRSQLRPKTFLVKGNAAEKVTRGGRVSFV